MTVMRAADIANRAALDARNAYAAMARRVAERAMALRPELQEGEEPSRESLFEAAERLESWAAEEIEKELAAAFTRGYCACVEERPAGNLPGPRKRRR